MIYKLSFATIDLRGGGGRNRDVLEGERERGWTMRGCIYHDWPGGYIFSGDVASSIMQFKTGTFKKMASSYRSLSKNTRDTET